MTRGFVIKTTIDNMKARVWRVKWYLMNITKWHIKFNPKVKRLLAEQERLEGLMAMGLDEESETIAFERCEEITRHLQALGYDPLDWFYVD